MAHFAQLDDQNAVTQVVVVNNEVINNEEFPASEPLGIEFLQSLFGSDTRWKQTSYSAKFRSRYAGIGMIYDEQADEFAIPQSPEE